MREQYTAGDDTTPATSRKRKSYSSKATFVTLRWLLSLSLSLCLSSLSPFSPLSPSIRIARQFLNGNALSRTYSTHGQLLKSRIMIVKIKMEFSNLIRIETNCNFKFEFKIAHNSNF